MSLAESKSITPSLPRTLPKAAAVKVHKAVEQHLAAIEAHREAADALIVFLDDAEGEADDEDDGTAEPSLSKTGSTVSPEHDDQGTSWFVACWGGGDSGDIANRTPATRARRSWTRTTISAGQTT